MGIRIRSSFTKHALMPFEASIVVFEDKPKLDKLLKAGHAMHVTPCHVTRALKLKASLTSRDIPIEVSAPNKSIIHITVQ